MIKKYINKLIENLPDSITKIKMPQKIDLVLDGGAFNGSYLLGAMYFLKKMEKKNYIKIERISGCSIGSVIGFLYYTDNLDSFNSIYEKIIIHLKSNYNLDINIHDYLSEKIPKDICKKVYKKLYITYNNVKTCKKIVKNTYKNLEQIFETIKRSVHLPVMIDGNILYKKKYMDGLNPYIFNKKHDRKILFLNLLSLDKLTSIINIKNENSNIHRVLSGLLEIHNFFIKSSETQMCSYVNDWCIKNKIVLIFRKIFEIVIIKIVYSFYFLEKLMPLGYKKNMFFSILSNLFHDICKKLLENYCF